MTGIILPVPPSVNALFANGKAGRGRFKTTKYKQWIELATWEFYRQRKSVARILGPYTIEIRLPHNMRGDVDNRTKAMLDLLVDLGVTDDDRYCQQCVAVRDPQRVSDCEVVVRSASAEAA
jgi:crossover junction endodeoxyribonuclease RusA